MDALAELGIKTLTTPLTPMKVWQAIRDAKGSLGDCDDSGGLAQRHVSRLASPVRVPTPGMTVKCPDRLILIRCATLQAGENSMRRLWTVLAALATLSLTNCGYNAIQTNDEQVKAAWSEVLNQYQRRADLVPNLVNSVKGFAQQEKDVLLGVTNARAKVGSIQATPELVNDPAAFQKFQAAQGELVQRAVAACWWSPRTIRSSNPTRCSTI